LRLSLLPLALLGEGRAIGDHVGDAIVAGRLQRRRGAMGTVVAVDRGR
jgi:hypothetical protein